MFSSTAVQVVVQRLQNDLFVFCRFSKTGHIEFNVTSFHFFQDGSDAPRPDFNKLGFFINPTSAEGLVTLDPEAVRTLSHTTIDWLPRCIAGFHASSTSQKGVKTNHPRSRDTETYLVTSAGFFDSIELFLLWVLEGGIRLQRGYISMLLYPRCRFILSSSSKHTKTNKKSHFLSCSMS